MVNSNSAVDSDLISELGNSVTHSETGETVQDSPGAIGDTGHADLTLPERVSRVTAVTRVSGAVTCELRL